jgi:hypothetical protein
LFSFSTYFFRLLAVGMGPYWKPMPLSRKNAGPARVDFFCHGSKKLNSWRATWIFTASMALAEPRLASGPTETRRFAAFV